MDLYECEGKAILGRSGVATPRGQFCSDVEQVLFAAAELGYPIVLKSQVLTGGRGKAGGIAVVHDAGEARIEAERILGLEIKGKMPAGLLAEDLLPEGRELYVAVTLDISRGAPVILFSPFGGVEVESNAAGLVRIHVPPTQETPVESFWIDEELAELVPEADLSPSERGRVAGVLADLVASYREHDLELLEINPLISTPSGLVAADAKIIIDDDAVFRQQEVVSVARSPLGPLESRAKEHGLNFVDLDGEVCLMGNGAGLCLSLLDGLAAFGSTAANFLDTGGGASEVKAHAGITILRDRGLADMKVRARLVMLSLAITRAKEAAEGIARALNEYPDDPVPTVAVVNGTGADEGRRILEAAGVSVAPDIRTGIEWAATARRRW